MQQKWFDLIQVFLVSFINNYITSETGKNSGEYARQTDLISLYIP